jgi:hypothetical protein
MRARQRRGSNVCNWKIGESHLCQFHNMNVWLSLDRFCKNVFAIPGEFLHAQLNKSVNVGLFQTMMCSPNHFPCLSTAKWEAWCICFVTMLPSTRHWNCYSSQGKSTSLWSSDWCGLTAYKKIDKQKANSYEKDLLVLTFSSFWLQIDPKRHCGVLTKQVPFDDAKFLVNKNYPCLFWFLSIITFNVVITLLYCLVVGRYLTHIYQFWTRRESLEGAVWPIDR